MSLLALCIKNWRVTAEAILLLLFISTLTLYRNAESEIDALKTQSPRERRKGSASKGSQEQIGLDTKKD